MKRISCDDLRSRVYAAFDSSSRFTEETDGHQEMEANVNAGRLSIRIGRTFGVLAFLALLGAWTTQLTGGTILGMGQQHFFNDATVLALLCIVGLLDGLVHSKESTGRISAR